MERVYSTEALRVTLDENGLRVMQANAAGVYEITHTMDDFKSNLEDLTLRVQEWFKGNQDLMNIIASSSTAVIVTSFPSVLLEDMSFAKMTFTNMLSLALKEKMHFAAFSVFSSLAVQPDKAVFMAKLSIFEAVVVG